MHPTVLGEVKKALRLAAKLINQGWSQNLPARRHDDRGCAIDSDEAEKFSIDGAILRSIPKDYSRSFLYSQAVEAVAKDIGITPFELFGWNNNPSRTKKEIVATLRKVAEKI